MWPVWYFLGMRGLTILLVTFAALLVMRGAQQPHFALLATAPCRPSTYPDTKSKDVTDANRRNIGHIFWGLLPRFSPTIPAILN